MRPLKADESRSKQGGQPPWAGPHMYKALLPPSWIVHALQCADCVTVCRHCAHRGWGIQPDADPDADPNANSGPQQLFGEWLPASCSLRFSARAWLTRGCLLSPWTEVTVRSPDTSTDKEAAHIDSSASRRHLRISTRSSPRAAACARCVAVGVLDPRPTSVVAGPSVRRVRSNHRTRRDLDSAPEGVYRALEGAYH